MVQPAKIVDASVDELLDNLKLHEYRTRYRTKRELRARDSSEVLSKLKKWVANLDKDNTKYEHHLLEALWVTWGLNKIDESLLRQLLNGDDFRARAAAFGFYGMADIRLLIKPIYSGKLQKTRMRVYDWKHWSQHHGWKKK